MDAETEIENLERFRVSIRTACGANVRDAKRYIYYSNLLNDTNKEIAALKAGNTH